MLLSLVLLLLAQNVAPPVSGATADLSAAIQLAQQGRNAEALVALQKIAAADPNNHLTRLWIANVHAQMGYPELAEHVYRSITAEDPQNVDAWVGLGTVLLQQDRISEGIDALNRAEQIAPENPSVWRALASGYELAGKTDRSISYYERVASTSPTATNRLNLENARRQYRHRLESQTFGEDYNGGTPGTRGEDLALNYRLSDAVRVIGRWQVERKFERNENRGGGGVEWRWTPWGTFTGQVLVNDSNRVLPQRDYLARVDYGYHRATYTAALRYFDFFGANATMFSPGVTVALTPRWTFGGKYAFTTTDTSLSSAVESNTVDLRAAHEILPRIWLRGGYIHGIENFDQFSIDHVGRFRANTGNAGVQFLLPSLTSILVDYDYQSREDDIKMQRLNIALVQAF